MPLRTRHLWHLKLVGIMRVWHYLCDAAKPNWMQRLTSHWVLSTARPVVPATETQIFSSPNSYLFLQTDWFEERILSLLFFSQIHTYCMMEAAKGSVLLFKLCEFPDETIQICVQICLCVLCEWGRNCPMPAQRHQRILNRAGWEQRPLSFGFRSV